MRDLPIERVMTTPPVVVEANTPAAEARATMAARGIHHLPVVAEGRLVGILGSAEIARAPANARAADVMQAQPVSIPSRATLQEAGAILASGMFHSLPVTAVGGAVVGIVTSTDLVRLLMEQLPTATPGREVPSGATRRYADAEELARAVLAAERRHAAGDDPEHLAAALLYLDGKARHLEAVLRAADLYLHSGQGEQEHKALVRAVARAKEAVRPDLAIGRA